jgi:class 3 adenylate cyclase
MAVLDVRWNSQITATLNLVRTAFIVAALALGITLMQRDAARLVLRPMERMLSKVRAVAENPLATKRARLESRGVPEREKLMETRILENAINKICSLLAVGFGDAGAEVIAGNMRSGGELDPVVPGRRVAGIFGFCDIRQFTDATEVLQEEVMGFVNTIAKIVHREVSLHGGAPNKNIGDAFLLVWKFPDGVDDASLAEALKFLEAQENAAAGGGEGGGGEEASSASGAAVAPGRELDIAITLQKVRRRRRRRRGRGRNSKKKSTSKKNSTPKTLSLSLSTLPPPPPPPPSHQARRLADQALASFLTIQAALRRSTRLRELTARSDVQERLPGFGVKMGFGLHVGWAIEGAIGSEYKIDASYLSPNVNMASRLEAATKQFGTSLLMSGDFARLLSPGVRARARQVRKRERESRCFVFFFRKSGFFFLSFFLSFFFSSTYLDLSSPLLPPPR